MRGIYWEAPAWEDYLEIQSDKTLLKKVNILIKDIQRNGYKCSYGKFEKLKHDFAGLASVRIDKKNRIVFHVNDKQVTIAECGGHYDDK